MGRRRAGGGGRGGGRGRGGGGEGRGRGRGEEEDLPLHKAARSGDAAAAESLCESDPLALNSRDRLSRTPLHLAAWAGHIEVVKCLCKHKADVGAAAMDDTAAIHFASQKGHMEVVRELLASGASVKAKNRKGFTALHFAAQNSHLELVKYLVKKGLDITAKTNGGQTALHVAENDDVRAFLKECEQALKKGEELPSEKKDDSVSEKSGDGKVSDEAVKDGAEAAQGEKRKSDDSGVPEQKKAKVSLRHLENDMEEEEEGEQ
ncbi:ankyrin repeat domain-containing protein 6 [Brachypodium distachyon]|uniref:Uncharacterized protein n=1 Tax=Brachypodium distachyon TaxID=15368 RepID=I1I355_BRADI|nr:ankyrin repeat domain-containing protein 6 [Brachypodium distachyon]KQJ96222.1 hypothetical protein BRADI_3g21630v3 [Brachypodium distachyon]|eukprot:XP_003573764.1 ankyrin repeat domain-containing protein 6 [Brachypodium distachyon]